MVKATVFGFISVLTFQVGWAWYFSAPTSPESIFKALTDPNSFPLQFWLIALFIFEVPLFNVFGPSTFSGTLLPVKNLYLGRRQDVNIEGVTGGGYFPGVLDEVSLYSVELTPGQIQSIFSNGVNGKCR